MKFSFLTQKKYNDVIYATEENTWILLTIENISEKRMRTLRSNRYYWGCVLKYISEYTGFTIEETHSAMKELFLSEENLQLGIKKIKSTTKLTTKEFSEYIEKIKLWAGEKLGVIIPESGE